MGNKRVREGRIYLVTNRANGKRYVGQTIRAVATRWSGHLSAARKGSQLPLHRAIRKYGEAAFIVETLAESLEPFLDALEECFIMLYATRLEQCGYNISPGGIGFRGGSRHPMHGRKQSPEHVAKRIAAHIGAKRSDEARRKISQKARQRTGWKHSEETRQKIGDAQRGRNIGKPMSETARAKISARNSGKNNPNYGRKASSEKRAKLSAAQQARWARYRAERAAVHS